eukprot:1914232-Rhodomonas_salina.1
MLAGSAVCWLVLPVDADVKHENRMINVKQHQTKRRQPIIRGTEGIGAENTRTLLRILAIGSYAWYRQNEGAVSGKTTDSSDGQTS